MSSYPGVYRAKCLSVEANGVRVYIPQLFGDTAVTVTQATGDFPTPGVFGYVSFEGGTPEYPVWLSSSSGATPRPQVLSSLQDVGGEYDVLRDQRTQGAPPYDAIMVVRDQSSAGGIRKVALWNDSLGQPIAWLLNEGGLKVTDNIAFLRGSDFQPMVRLGWLDETNNKAPAVIFGFSGTGGSTVTAGGETVILDAGKDNFLRERDDASLQYAKAFRAGSSSLTSIGPVGPSLEPGLTATPAAGSGTVNLYRKAADVWRTDDALEVAVAPSGAEGVARLLEVPPQPSMLPAGNSGTALTTSTVAMTGSNFYVVSSDWTVPTGMKLQMRASQVFTGHTSGDVLGVEVFDAASASVVISEGTVTTTNGNAHRARTAWADVPSTAWQGTLRVRNQTAARGNARQGWLEFRFIPV